MMKEDDDDTRKAQRINPGVRRFAAFCTPEGGAHFADLGAGPQRNKNCVIHEFFSKGTDFSIVSNDKVGKRDAQHERKLS